MEGTQMAKKSKKVRKQKAAVVDVKKAAANDKETPIEVKRVPESGSAVAKGAAYSVLAGRPSKQAVTAVFGKTGYALSWFARAARMNVTPENLCAWFKAEPQKVKADWGQSVGEKVNRFKPGQVVATPGALAVLEASGEPLLDYAQRHVIRRLGNRGRPRPQRERDPSSSTCESCRSTC